MNEHKHAEVLRAIADGKEVEYWCVDSEEWVSGGHINPLTSYNLRWRIKPEPKPPIVAETCLGVGSMGWFYDPDLPPNARFTFDPDTKLPIKVELI